MAKKSTQTTARKKQHSRTGSAGRILLVFLLVMALFAGALLAVERQQLPEATRDNSYVIELYALRDSVKTRVSDYIHQPARPKKPLSITPSATKTDRKEVGYNEKDREGMEALIREEGTTP